MNQDLLDQFTIRARAHVDEAVEKTERKFQGETYPVRPAYRRAVYRRFRKLKQALKDSWDTLVEETGMEETAALTHSYSQLKKQYLREYGVRTQKKEEKAA